MNPNCSTDSADSEGEMDAVKKYSEDIKDVRKELDVPRTEIYHGKSSKETEERKDESGRLSKCFASCIISIILELTTCRDFKNVESVRYLFNSLLIPILDYDSVIWSLHNSCYQYKLEPVQRKIFRYLVLKMGEPNILIMTLFNCTRGFI